MIAFIQTMRMDIIINIRPNCSIITVEPPIVDPPRLGHSIIDLSTKDTGQGPKI